MQCSGVEQCIVRVKQSLLERKGTDSLINIRYLFQVAKLMYNLARYISASQLCAPFQ